MILQESILITSVAGYLGMIFGILIIYAVSDAEAAGVQSVPALVLDNNNVLHINFGASMEDVKAA